MKELKPTIPSLHQLKNFRLPLFCEPHKVVNTKHAYLSITIIYLCA